MCEQGTWNHVFPYADRLNDASPILNNIGFALAVEKLAGLELIRRVETGGEPVDIKRRGKVVARLAPPPRAAGEAPRKPWERLRGSGEGSHGVIG